MDIRGLSRIQQHFRGLRFQRVQQRISQNYRVPSRMLEGFQRSLQDLRGWDISRIQQGFRSLRFQRSEGFQKILGFQRSQQDLRRIQHGILQDLVRYSGLRSSDFLPASQDLVGSQRTQQDLVGFQRSGQDLVGLSTILEGFMCYQRSQHD